MYLISQYLNDAGLDRTRTVLCDEAQLNYQDFKICDNVDLETIYLEFCSYYQIKFGKKPRFVKKNENPVSVKSMSLHGSPTSSSTITSTNSSRLSMNKKRNSLKTAPNTSTVLSELPIKLEKDLESSLLVSGLSPHDSLIHDSLKAKSNLTHVNLYSKPMAEFYDNHPSDWRDMTEMICRDIIKKDLCVQWDHIRGAEDAKMIIHESVIFPLKYPHLFTGDVKPWKAVLFHGVPGTGKTLLARALCSETHENITFFNIAASTLTSKWRGESEKLIRVLFEVAKFHGPSIIFIDELDSLTSKRSSCEHEASKRFKNEFLSLLDGLDSDDGEKQRVFVLGSTNLPWEIDSAFLRRFERKILIDVPKFEERKDLIKQYLPAAEQWSEMELNDLADCTDNFTGDDIRVGVKESNMMLIRNRISSKAGKKFNKLHSRSKYLLNQYPQISSQFHHRDYVLKFGN